MIERGGLAFALAKMAMRSGRGAIIDLKSGVSPLMPLLFSEDRPAVLMTCQEADGSRLQEMFGSIPHRKIGRVQGDALQIRLAEDTLLERKVEAMASAHERTIPEIVAGRYVVPRAGG